MSVKLGEVQSNPYKLSAIPNYIYYDGVNDYLKETKKLGLNADASAIYIIKEALQDVPSTICSGDETSLGALSSFVYEATREY